MSEVAVAKTIQKKLGPSMETVLASLWPIDCQTCNRSLKTGGQTALVVDDMITFATVSLHHSRCRPSTWNDDRMLPMSNQATLSHWLTATILSTKRGDDPEESPWLFLNPGLEMIHIARADGGSWEVQLGAMFSTAGFAPPPFRVDEPVPGAHLVRSGSTFAIVLDEYAGMIGPYQVTVTKQERDLIVANGGAFVAVTHALNPGELHDPRQIVPAMQGDRTIMGRVRLAG